MNILHAQIPGLEDIHGQPIGVEVINLAQNEHNGIPIYVVRAGILPGHVDNPRLIFGNALKLAYTAVLNHTHQNPDPDDLVQLQLQHPDIKSHGGFFHSFNLVIQRPGPHLPGALDGMVERWEQVQQSDTNIHLNDGALNATFIITLPNYHPPAEQNAYHVGVLSKKIMYCRSIYNEWYTHTNALKRTPDTEQFCWPMSFLGCQVRQLKLSDDQKYVIDVLESSSRECFPNTASITPSLYEYVPVEDFELGEKKQAYAASGSKSWKYVATCCI